MILTGKKFLACVTHNSRCTPAMTDFCEKKVLISNDQISKFREAERKREREMGNCLAKAGSLEIKHERLNEHNDRYFAKVQARNSIAPKKRWWKQTPNTVIDEQPEEWTSPTLTDPCVTADPEDEKPPSPVRSISEEHSQPISPFSPSKKDKSRKRLKVDAQVNGWQVKTKGNALQLRLAKNRFLQLAATSDMLSPITLDSGTKSSSKSFNPLDSSRMSEELNIDFDSSMCTGMIWVEVARSANVSAVSMSRTTWTGAKRQPLLLAVGSEDGVVTLTEILDEQQPSKSGQEDQSSVMSSPRKFGETLEFQAGGRIRSIDFSPDGSYMAIGGDSCVAIVLKIILDPNSNTLLSLQALQKVERVDRVYAVQYSPDSSMLAIGGFDGEVALVNMVNLLSPEGDTSPVQISRPGLILCLDWSPDGSFLAIGGSDKSCAIFDKSHNLIHESTRSTSIQTMQWNHDGTYLALGDREVAILEAGTFEVKCEICYTPSSPGSNASRYRISALCWSPDGSFLAVGGSDGICLVVETIGYALVHEIRRTGYISSLAWGQLRMANGGFRRYLAVSDEGCNVALLKAGAENEGSISESDDLSSTASSSYFSNASDWILRDDCFRDIEESAADTSKGIKAQGNIIAIAFSRASKSKSSSYLAYAAEDCSLTIMTTRDWKAVFQMEFAKPIRSLMFSNSSNFLALGGDEGVMHDERLAVGSDDGVLSLLCPDADWEPAGEIETSDSPILAQDWCSKHMAVGRLDGSVAIFDTEKVLSNFFLPIAEFSHSHPVRSVAFGASGRFLAVGGDSGLVSILSAKGGWVLCNQIKLGCSISSTKWSPGGRFLAFAGSNKTFRVMDTITWVEVSEVRDSISSVLESQSVQSMCGIDWSIDGKWVAVGSMGGGIHVLGTSAWELLAPSIDNLCLLAAGATTTTTTKDGVKK